VRHTKHVQAYTVASGIIVDQRQVLLVQNQRRNGSLDWSTPGGVVDPGEEVLEALQREVIEETCVVVDGWSPVLYTVDVEFVGREMSLHAQVFRAQAFGGQLHVDDPDGVVVDGRWVDLAETDELLNTSPLWVAEPLRHSFEQISEPVAPAAQPMHWCYRVTGPGRDYTVERVDSQG